MMKRWNIVAAAAAVGAIVLMSGCFGLAKKPVDFRSYLLEVRRPAELPKRPRVAEELWLERVAVLPPWNVQNLVLRRSGAEYQTTFRSELLVAPAENIRNIVFDWLNDSGLFKDVTLTHRRGVDAALAVTVTRLYGDLSSGEAVVELRAALLRPSDSRVLLARTYSARVPVKENSAEALVEAYDTALARILVDLEKDLADTLGAGDRK